MENKKFTGIKPNTGFSSNITNTTNWPTQQVEVLATFDHKAGSLKADGTPRKVDAMGVNIATKSGNYLVSMSQLAHAQKNNRGDFFSDFKEEKDGTCSGTLKLPLVVGCYAGLLTSRVMEDSAAATNKANEKKATGKKATA